MALGRDRPSVAPSRARTGQGRAGALLASASCSVHTRSLARTPEDCGGAVRVAVPHARPGRREQEGERTWWGAGVAGQRVRPLCLVSCERAPCRAGKA